MQGAHPRQTSLTIIDTNLTYIVDRSDHLGQPVRPVESVVQQQAELVAPVSAPHDEEVTSISSTG